MFIIQLIIGISLALLAAVGWGKFFKEKLKIESVVNHVEALRQIYMTTVFGVWQHLEFLELEHPEMLEESTIQNLSTITAWNTEENQQIEEGDSDGHEPTS